MFIVFVIDTSASMNQKTVNGMTFLDCAKSAVEHFLKVRGRDTLIRNDRFFLITTEDGPSAIKAGWKENFPTFVQEVKNLSAKDLSGIGPALKKAFDLLNQFRFQTGKDNYGQGRLPWISDPSMIILLSDGGALTTTTNILDQFTLPVTPMPGSELTQEPFRWDQRLFSVVLRFNSVSSSSSSSASSSLPEPLTSAMCDVTGGKTTIVTSMKALLQTVEGLVGRMQPGVVVNFEPISLNSQTAIIGPGPTLHKMIYVRNPVGFWPIPEGFYIDPLASQLPPRTAHPTIRYTQVGVEPQVIENFPFDKYELEPSPLSQFLLQNRGPSQMCWQTFVSGSGLNGHGEPFGYLKASTAGNVVNLFVLPYNYTKLFPLLEDLVRTQMSPTPKWRVDFENYLGTIPSYYIGPMKNAMKRFGAPPNIISESEGKLNPNIVNYMAKLKQLSKMEPDRTKIKDTTPAFLHPTVPAVVNSKPLPARVTPVIPRNYHQMLNKGSDVGQQQAAVDDKSAVAANMYNTDNLDGGYFGSEVDGLDTPSYLSDSGGMYDAPSTPSHTNIINLTCKNAFDIDRNNLLEQIEKLRDVITNKRKFEDDESKRVPIGEMGNYQELLKKLEVFRDVLEDEKSKRPLFGNPFRLEKGPKNGVDEADETEGEAAGLRRGRKKRLRSPRGGGSPGPSPPSSPLPSPPSSPSSSSQSPPSTPPQNFKKPPPQKSAKPFPQSGFAGFQGQVHHGHVQKQPKASGPLPLNSANIPLPSSPLPLHPSTPLPPSSSSPSSSPSDANSATNIPMANIPSSSLSGDVEMVDDVVAFNNDIKGQIIKELRKQGKNNEIILEKLKSLKGGNDVKKAILQEIIEHAKKYKKATLIGQLEAIERSLGV